MKRLCLGLMICAGIFGLSKVVMASPVSFGETELVKGSAFIVRNGEHQVLEPGEAVYPMDTIVTADSGRVKLTLDDGSSIFVSANSQLAIWHYAVKYGYRIAGHFHVLSGKVRFMVRKVEGLDARFSVETKSANVDVTGTDFTVIEHLGMNPTQVLLRTGQIIARTKKEGNFMMKPGQVAQIVSNGEISIHPMTPQDIALFDLPADFPEGKPALERNQSDQKGNPSVNRLSAKVTMSDGAKVNAPKVNVPKIHAPKI